MSNVSEAQGFGLPFARHMRRQVRVSDLVIVGAGPAGLAAAVYGGSEGLDVLLLEANSPKDSLFSPDRAHLDPVELLFQLVERIVANVSLRSQLKEELASRGNRAPMNVVMVRIRSVRIASITVGPAQVSGEFMPDHPSRVRRVAVQGSERCLHDALTCSRDLSFNQVVVVDSKHSQQGPERQALDDQRAEHD